LTDGEVSNTSEVLEQIKKKHSRFLRVFTVGIGSGCSEELIIEGAEKGKGKYIFIEDSE
jgi:hypothetical protein